MADPFPVSGNIEATTFPHLLVDLHRQGATGSLKVNGPVHPKALYFRAGRILFGSSNDPRDQLGAILIESGKITREQLDEVNEKVGPGNPLAKVLAESGFVNQRELGFAARVKVERILSDVVSWTTGTFEFEDGVLPKGAVDLKLSTSKLLLAAIQRIADREFVLRHLGGDMTVVLEAVPDAEALADIRAEVWPLLERLDGQRALQDAVALTRLEEFEAAKVACALLFLGIVQRKTPASSDELDLAEQALSGLDQPAAGATGDGGAPDEGIPAITPSETAFSLLDGNSDEQGEISAFPSPEGPSGSPSEPLGVAPEEPLGVAPEEEPIGVAPEAEPLGVAPEEPPIAASPTPEPTGFSFVEEAHAPPAPTEAFATPALEAETTGFAIEPPVEEPAPFFSTEPPVPVEPPPSPPAPEMEEPVPGFAVEPPRREGVDTVPGDRETVSPEPAPEIPVAEPVAPFSPEPSDTAPPPAGAPAPASSPDSSSGPTQEDLAALDALLNPSQAGAPGAGIERPKPWEPQFHPSPSSTLGPNATTRRAVGRRSRPSSRAPLYAVFATVVIAALGAGYFFLGMSPGTEPVEPEPTVAPTPALSAPVTVAAAPTPVPTPTAPEDVPPTPEVPALAPTPDPGLEPTAAPPAATPTPAPTPVPTPTPAPAPAPAGDGLALLRQGAFDESARAFASALATTGPGVFSIQVLAACSPDTIRKAAENVGGDEIFILPVTLNGRACYRVGWGIYDSRASAEAGARDLPPYFRQSGITPRIQPLAELLP